MWEVRSLADVSDRIMVGIASAATHAYRNKGVPLLRNQNIKHGFLDDRDVLYVDPGYELAFRNKRLKAGDLLTARTGYPGMTCVVPVEYEGAQSFTTLITRPNKATVDSRFLCHFVNSAAGQSFFERSQIGGAQKNVNAGTLRGMPVPVPTLDEQRAIAEALSDVDALLNSLDRLIAKKRDLQQAAQHQLVTGQTRLPGFNEEWGTTSLGRMGATYGGLSGKTKADFGGGSARYIPFMNIMANIVVDAGWLEPVRLKPSETQNRTQRGDLFFNGSSETPGELGMCAVLMEDLGDVYLNSFCFGFRFSEGVKANGAFFARFFRSNSGRRLLYSLAQGAIRYNLSKAALLKLSFPVPGFEEQVAIAAVLSDMDAEIAALEQRRDKTRLLKQGMMQELLTGRTRLV